MTAYIPPQIGALSRRERDRLADRSEQERWNRERFYRIRDERK